MCSSHMASEGKRGTTKTRKNVQKDRGVAHDAGNGQEVVDVGTCQFDHPVNEEQEQLKHGQP